VGEQVQKVLPLVQIGGFLLPVQQQNRVSQIYHQPAKFQAQFEQIKLFAGQVEKDAFLLFR